MRLHIYILIFVFIAIAPINAKKKENNDQDRRYWVKVLDKIARPVMENIANETLKQNMPFESLSTGSPRFSHLEAFGRTICGISSWLELGADESPEGKLRKEYIELSHRGLDNAVNPQSPDYLIFDQPSQPLVDAAFLAQGLYKAENQLWKKLSTTTRNRLIDELKKSRNIKPGESNWLLFASMVEAFILRTTGECDTTRLYYGVDKFMEKWYRGDAIYGDGENVHLDYYNSFVIHPMLHDILAIIDSKKMDSKAFYAQQSKRLSRHAEQLERLISPEGSYPAVGRSIVYRTGVFHGLGQAALHHLLPQAVSPSQVRCALTSVIKRQFSSKENFDKDGWLRVGFNGSQIEMSEYYINTGSLYLCLSGFLPLGLPDTDPFWSDEKSEWTNKKAWNGKKAKADKAIK